MIRSLVCIALLFPPLAAVADIDLMPRSGFLPDEIYNQLEVIETGKKVQARRWLGPKLSFANYDKVLVDEVVIYPEPEPTAQVSEETLKAISAYTTQLLRQKTGEVLNLATEAGPGVVRTRVALTGFLVKTEGMKAYEVLPVTAIFGAAKAMTGTRAQDVWVFYETRIEDSISGELVGATMRAVEGKDLKGKKDKLTLEDMKASLDAVTDQGKSVLSEAMQPE